MAERGQMGMVEKVSLGIGIASAAVGAIAMTAEAGGPISPEADAICAQITNGDKPFAYKWFDKNKNGIPDIDDTYVCDVAPTTTEVPPTDPETTTTTTVAETTTTTTVAETTTTAAPTTTVAATTTSVAPETTTTTVAETTTTAAPTTTIVVPTSTIGTPETVVPSIPANPNTTSMAPSMEIPVTGAKTNIELALGAVILIGGLGALKIARRRPEEVAPEQPTAA